MKITRRQLRKIIKEAHHDHGGYDDAEDWYEERRLMDMDDRVRDVPQDMMDRVMNLRRGDLQDHMLDLVDAYEAKFEQEPGGIPLSMLVKNLEDAERMDETKTRRRSLSERLDPRKIKMNVLEMGSRPSGASLDMLNSMYGSPAFDAIDELVDENRGILDEEEGVFYSMNSSGIQKMLQRRGLS